MKCWYSKVRDTELINGSVIATYVVTFETDSFELKREVEKYLQGIMDRADRKTENKSEIPTDSTVSILEQVGTTEDCSVVDAIRQAKACIERLATWSKTYEAMHMDTERKTEPSGVIRVLTTSAHTEKGENRERLHSKTQKEPSQ